MSDYAVQFNNITKYFPGVKVLDSVSFKIKTGEVHALLGENGAGKSTLLNILHGVYSDYEGDVYLFDKKVLFKTPYDAIHNGKISKVHQEVHVVDELTVGQNVTLGHEPSKYGFINYNQLNQKVDEILDRIGCSFRSNTIASTLTAGQMQMMAIAKALFHNSSIISLDEPTASLTTKEVDNLFKVIKDLKSHGITIIYVSHRMEEIFQICDRATILRDGVYINTHEISNTDRKDLIQSMVGRALDTIYPRSEHAIEKKEVVLEIIDFNKIGVFKNINFSLHRGEILGFAGLVGAGRTEIMRAIYGADSVSSGVIKISGKEVTIKNTQDALKNNIGFLPEERKTQGFINFRSNKDNAALSSLKNNLTYGFVSDKKKTQHYNEMAEKLMIQPKDPEYLTSNMSGGNQQKVILARWISTNAEILIFDEPTKGVDIAAKYEIYKLMEEIVKLGKSIILVSSELPEVMGMSDRIIVLNEGTITAELNRNEFDEHTLITYALGGKKK